MAPRRRLFRQRAPRDQTEDRSSRAKSMLRWRQSSRANLEALDKAGHAAHVHASLGHNRTAPACWPWPQADDGVARRDHLRRFAIRSELAFAHGSHRWGRHRHPIRLATRLPPRALAPPPQRDQLRCVFRPPLCSSSASMESQWAQRVLAHPPIQRGCRAIARGEVFLMNRDPRASPTGAGISADSLILNHRPSRPIVDLRGGMTRRALSKLHASVSSGTKTHPPSRLTPDCSVESAAGMIPVLAERFSISQDRITLEIRMEDIAENTRH